MLAGRFCVILRRWISLVCCGTVAATVVVAFSPLLRRLSAPAVDRLSTMDPIAITLLVAVLTIAACWGAARGRWRGFVGVRYFFTYPPLWFAVLVAIGVLLAASVWFDGVDTVELLVQDIQWFVAQLPVLLRLGVLLLVASAVILPLRDDFVAILRKYQNGLSHGSVVEGGQSAEDFEGLCDWLRDDSPIDSPAADCFEHNHIALRMAQRLGRKDGAPTMALIGPLGSGKSSICELVKHDLRNQSEVRFIRVSLWPFDSTEAAVRGVLRAILDELSRHVNVLPLVGLSEDYVTAIENTAGRYAGIARLLRGTLDPEKILGQFSTIAHAAGLHLVLWIEDLERFSGGDQLEGELRVQREVERLGPIRAFLYLLDRCSVVSVVVSDTSLRTRFDLGKIARFVEQVPPMEMELVWRFTNLLRTRCLSDYPIAIIDPTAPRVRQAFVPTQDASRLREWLSEFGNRACWCS